MPRNMSFSMTPLGIINQTKTVTRRRKWKFLKVGDILWAVEKSMGLAKGEKVKRLAKIRVTDVRRESLNTLTRAWGWGLIEMNREGLPDIPPSDFVHLWMEHFGGKEDQMVTRIEFEYLENDDA